MKQTLIFLLLAVIFLGCGLSSFPLAKSDPTITPTFVVAQFNTATPTPTVVTDSPQEQAEPESPTPAPTFTPLPSPTPMITPIEPPTATPTSPVEPTLPPEPPPLSTPVPPADTPVSPPVPNVDFVMRFVRLRTNEENSWDGVLGAGQCGNDHSIYVHVADAQENLLDGVLIGDKFGNFEVPTGVDGPGAVRILVWSATMELAVMGHQDGTRYTSDFTPPLSTLDEDIPPEWLQEAGYCESPEDCQWRVENNQLCRGHYSYDVIFQRMW